MLRTRRRNWSGCCATPIRARQTARKETAQGQAEADLRVRCWPRVERFRRLVPTAAECCSPRPTPAPDRPENPRRAWIPPISPLAPSRPEPRQARMHRRRPSRPVCITGAQNARRSHTGSRRLLAASNSLQPRVDGGPRGDSFQLATKEFLHGLALQRRARREFVADILGDTSDGDLNRHEGTLPAMTAFSKQWWCAESAKYGAGLRCGIRLGARDPQAMVQQPLPESLRVLALVICVSSTSPASLALGPHHGNLVVKWPKRCMSVGRTNG